MGGVAGAAGAAGASAPRQGLAGARARGCSTAAAAKPVAKGVPEALAVPLGPAAGAAERAVVGKLTAGSRFLVIALTCNRFIML